MNSKATTLLGWAIILILVFLWTNHKSQQAQARTAQERADSLAAVQSAPTESSAHAAPPAAPTARDEAYSADTAAAVEEALVESSEGTKPETVRSEPSPRQIKVETNRFTVTLDNLGARLSGLRIQDLEGHVPYKSELLDVTRKGALTLQLGNNDLGEVRWRTEAEHNHYRVSKSALALVFTREVPGIGTVKRTYTFHPDSTGFSHELEIPDYSNAFSLHWDAGLNETEKLPEGDGFGLLASYFSELVLYNGNNVLREAISDRKTFNEESGVMEWVGLRRKYVATLLNFNGPVTHAVTARVIHDQEGPADAPKTYSLEIKGQNYDAGSLNFDFKVLPLSYEKLKAYNEDYHKIIFSGWEWFLRADIWYVALCGMVLNLLNFFYGLIPNYGVAIILLTLLVRTVTFPLTISQTKSAAKMQLHTPAITKIREKHKGQPQKMNQEIMAYYQKAGVNPFASMLGCFPVLLQMPIFISLFNVLGRAVELKGANFFGWIGDLSHPDVIIEAIRIPYIFPLGLTVLPFLMAGTMYVQMKLTIKDPNQKFMIWMMPLMMFVFSCSFPSGLVLYWTVSNVFTIGQTYFYTSKVTKSFQAAGLPSISTGETPPKATTPKLPKQPPKQPRKRPTKKP